MNEEEMLARIAKLSITPETNVVPSELATALMAVVKLHKPEELVFENKSQIYCDGCNQDYWEPYPCKTIKAIEQHLK